MCRIKIKVNTTVASGANVLKNYKECLNTIESGLKSTRASDLAVVLTPILNIPQKLIKTRWDFKVKPKKHLMARLVALGWKQRYDDCGIRFAFVCIFD